MMLMTEKDDPPCLTGGDSVGDVETAGGACSVVWSANLTFFMSVAASED